MTTSTSRSRNRSIERAKARGIKIKKADDSSSLRRGLSLRTVGDLVDENKGAEAKQKAQEDPFDLGPVLFQGGAAIGQDEINNGQKKKNDHVRTEYLKTGAINPEDGNR